MRPTDSETLVLDRCTHEAPTASGQRIRELDRGQVNRFTADSFAAQHVIVSPALGVSKSEHHRGGSEWVKISNRNESKEERDEENGGEHGVANQGTAILFVVAIVKLKFLGLLHSVGPEQAQRL